MCVFRHRINTSEFRQLDFLSNKFVVQVACGQQHAICRAVDRAAAEQSAEAVLVGSNCGADAYVWGNGTLGQLGLGECICSCISLVVSAYFVHWRMVG